MLHSRERPIEHVEDAGQEYQRSTDAQVSGGQDGSRDAVEQQAEECCLIRCQADGRERANHQLRHPPCLLLDLRSKHTGPSFRATFIVPYDDAHL